MNLTLKDIIEESLLEATVASMKDVARVENIIRSYTQEKGLPYRDFVIRLGGFTNGLAAPKDKPEAIDVRPVIDKLVAAGYLRAKGNAFVKTSDALSRVISKEYKRSQDEKSTGKTGPDKGRLSMAHTDRVSPLLDPDRTKKAGDILDKQVQQSYKAGGRYSGFTREQIQKLISKEDPEWMQLSESAKSMVSKLNSLDDPLKSFTILKYLIRKSSLKKSYTDIIMDIKQNFGEDFDHALMDLETIGVIDNNKINWNEVKSIRELINYIVKGDFEDINRDEIASALLPKFNAEAKSKSASKYRAVNAILASNDPKYKTALSNVNRLTDAGLKYIINSDEPADYKESASVISIIKFLAKTFGVDTAEDLRSSLAEKAKNREFFKSDENKSAKSQGRIREFAQQFMI